MFALTKLCSDNQNFINQLISNNKTRSEEVNIALARILSSRFSLPTEPVVDVVSYFRQQHQLTLEVDLNQLNEILVIDLARIKELALKFYQYRYNTAFGDKNFLAVKPDSGIVDFFSISRYFDSETLKVIATNPVVLTDYNNKFNRLVEELKN